jgi:hypothetical protein
VDRIEFENLQELLSGSIYCEKTVFLPSLWCSFLRAFPEVSGGLSMILNFSVVFAL